MYHVSLYLSRDLYVCIKRSIIGNWLTRLWSTTGSKICRVTQQTDDSQWDSYNPWAWEPGEPEVGSNLKAGKSHCPSLKAFRQGEFFLTWGGSAFLFYSDFQLSRRGPPTVSSTVSFTQCPDSDVNLIVKHPHRFSQNNVWPNMWAPLNPVKLTHKIDHHVLQLGSCPSSSSHSSSHLVSEPWPWHTYFPPLLVELLFKHQEPVYKWLLWLLSLSFSCDVRTAQCSSLSFH